MNEETESFERAVIERLDEIQRTLDFLDSLIQEERRDRELAEIRRKP